MFQHHNLYIYVCLTYSMELTTIRGEPVIDIYESFDGSYWFVTDKAWKQDSVIGDKIYEDDQILFGYVRLSGCPECAEFGYFSEAELRSLGSRVWKVHRQDWAVCPCVAVEPVPDQPSDVGAASCGGCAGGRSCSKAHKGGYEDEAAGI